MSKRLISELSGLSKLFVRTTVRLFIVISVLSGADAIVGANVNSPCEDRNSWANLHSPLQAIGFGINSAHADKLCRVAPASYEWEQISGTTMGKWRVGTGCHGFISDAIADAVTSNTCTTVVAEGDAACADGLDYNNNYSNIIHADKSNTNARACFCKMTSPKNTGAWVLNYVYTSSSACANYCAYLCAYSVVYNSQFRAAVLASP